MGYDEDSSTLYHFWEDERQFISYIAVRRVQEEDNVIPLHPFCAFPNVNATFRKSALSRPFDVPPNVNATNLERFLAPHLGNMFG